MSCDVAQQFLVNAGWDASTRRRVAEFLRHAEQCDVCGAALEDYDAIRRACSPVSDEVSEPEGGWEAMERRLAASIQRRQTSGQPSSGLQLQNAPQAVPLNRWLRPAFAVAASLLMAAAGFEVSRLFSPGRNHLADVRQTLIPPGQETTVMKVLSPPEVSQAVHEFREVSRRGYRGRAGWMLVSGSQSSVGVVPPGDLLTKKMLFLRLALLRGKESVSFSDLMIRAGQDADLTVPLPAGQSLHYQIGTSTDEPTHLTVWLDLKTPHGGEPLAALGTNLQVQPGQKLTAGKFATSAGEYELMIEFASADLSEDKP